MNNNKINWPYHRCRRETPQARTLYKHLSFGTRLFIAFSLLSFVWVPQSVMALTLEPDIQASTSKQDDLLNPISPYSRALIERLQQALKDIGSYSGDITGVIDDETDRAIRAYQRTNRLGVNGVVDEQLVDKIESSIDINKLLKQLAETREAHTKKAREALLNNPATRDLLEKNEKADELADATRDAGACFDAPTTTCLLNEAVESAKSVPRDEMRNWAFGEILAIQARTGLHNQARETARQITDPRLIIVALGQIALAQAQTGNVDLALNAARTIPSERERINALLDVVKQNTDSITPPQMSAVHDQINTDLKSIPDPIKKIGFLSKLASLYAKLSQNDQTKDISKSLMVQLEELQSKLQKPSQKDPAKRFIAETLVKQGQIEQASIILKTIDDEDQRTPIYLSIIDYYTSNTQSTDQAYALSEKIPQYRYKISALVKISRTHIKAGAYQKAWDTLSLLTEMLDKVSFPFARDYARSQVALALIELSITSPSDSEESFDLAQETLNLITDERLRAETSWRFSYLLHPDLDPKTSYDAQSSLVLTEVIPSPLTQIWLLSDLGDQRLLLGNKQQASDMFDLALQITRNIKNPWARARSLARLSSSLIALTEMP